MGHQKEQCPHRDRVDHACGLQSAQQCAEMGNEGVEAGRHDHLELRGSAQTLHVHQLAELGAMFVDHHETADDLADLRQVIGRHRSCGPFRLHRGEHRRETVGDRGFEDLPFAAEAPVQRAVAQSESGCHRPHRHALVAIGRERLERSLEEDVVFVDPGPTAATLDRRRIHGRNSRRRDVNPSCPSLAPADYIVGSNLLM